MRCTESESFVADFCNVRLLETRIDWHMNAKQLEVHPCTKARLRRYPLAGFLFLSLCVAASAQQIQWGPMLGISPSTNFRPRQQTTVPIQIGDAPAYESASVNLIGGFTAQGNISPDLHWSADILFRRLRYQAAEGPLLLGGTRQWTDTVQLPVLLRYSLPGNGVRPFVEAGPSFRFVGEDELTQPSRAGFSAGAGLFIPVGQMGILPRLRYTRWQQDGDRALIRTKPDQIEILVGFTGERQPGPPRSNSRVLLGATFGGALNRETIRVVENLSSPVFGNVGTLSNSWSQSRWIGGPSAEVRIAGGLATEVNLLIRDARLVTRVETDAMAEGPRASAGTTRRVHAELPVLAKYRFTNGKVQPFVVGGASFAGRSNRFGAQGSNTGFTSGIGFDMPSRGNRFGGQFRYTRWGEGTGPGALGEALSAARLPRNDLYILVGFAF
jgi:hypothetical protein